jgi:hypothetical protein
MPTSCCIMKSAMNSGLRTMMVAIVAASSEETPRSVRISTASARSKSGLRRISRSSFSRVAT